MSLLLRRGLATKTLFPTPSVRSILAADIPVENNNVLLRGWIRSVRKQKSVCFAVLNDGTTLKGIQAILNGDDADKLTTGACVELQGSVTASPGKEQSKEIQVHGLRVLGECDGTYPLQKKRHTHEFLRTINHLRARGNVGSAVLRVRNAASEGLHQFFAGQEFIQVHTPILTSHDCEGAGEVFKVTPSTAPSDFFKKPAFLTVSGQLHAEMLASAMSRVYTFGPVFRAEESLTSRHLAEFWMLEAEMTFIDQLDQLLDVTEASVQQTTSHVLSRCSEDIELFNRWTDTTLLDRLHKSIDQPFVRMTYTEAIEILQKTKKKFEFPTTWGSSLQTEHERYLASEYCGRPVFVTDYPTHLKPFYMRANDDNGKTVSCFDLLIPGVGELVGGSMREERHDILKKKMEAAAMNVDEYQWYLDLRKYGSAPHGGYGIGFERLLLWLTGLENVREVVPVPRWFGHCNY